MAVMEEDTRRRLVRKVRPDHFLVRENREAWTAIEEVTRSGLEMEFGTIERLASTEVAQYVRGLVEVYADANKNVDWHVANLMWDAARSRAASGPLPAFLEALRDTRADPGRVQGLARALASSFDGYADRRFMREGNELVRSQMLEIEKRVSGQAAFPYGIRGLDFFDIGDPPRKRMIPGAAPGKTTVITGMSGSGKSTMTARIALGIAGFDLGGDGSFIMRSDFRKILYGAWEMDSGITMELLACISLGWSRSDLMEGVGYPATQEGREQLQERMGVISKRIQFFDNPFWKDRKGKLSNEANLDVVAGYIADSGCDVFIADLWKRCLVDDQPSAEENALIRQQAMLEDLKVHGILIQQQRLKDMEQRPDKRPTREGIKGSGAWVEVADTLIAPHRPALWKKIDDDKLEVFILKQRYGKWPCGIEFDWVADTGQISGGRSIEYDRPGEGNDIDATASAFLNQRGSGRSKYNPNRRVI